MEKQSGILHQSKVFWPNRKAIYELAGFHVNEQKTSVFTTPSLALNFGHSLVKVADMRRGNAVRQMVDLMKRECDGFLKIHCSDWAPAVSSVALATLQTNKYYKPLALPITNDLVLKKKLLGWPDKCINYRFREAWRKCTTVEEFWLKLCCLTKEEVVRFPSFCGFVFLSNHNVN